MERQRELHPECLIWKSRFDFLERRAMQGKEGRAGWTARSSPHLTPRLKFFVVVLLRDDIYKSLQFEDRNKLTENYLSLIEWDTPPTQKTLKEIMEKRFDVRLRDKPDEKIKWAEVAKIVSISIVQTVDVQGHVNLPSAARS